MKRFTTPVSSPSRSGMRQSEVEETARELEAELQHIGYGKSGGGGSSSSSHGGSTADISPTKNQD